MSALTIAGFEFRSRLKLVSTWVYFLVFFCLALLWIAAAGGLFKDASVSFGSGKVAVNSPFAMAQTVAILGMFGVTVMPNMPRMAIVCASANGEFTATLPLPNEMLASLKRPPAAAIQSSASAKKTTK